MSNLKWGLVLSLFALVISAALGIISGVNPFYIFVRSIIFAVVFFGVGTGIHVIINTYFPELLYFDDGPETQISFEQPEQGSHINITLGSSGDYALPELYKNPNEQELGNIGDLISGTFKPRSKRNMFDSSESPVNDRNESSLDFQTEDASDGDNWTNPLPPIDRNEEEDYNEGKSSGGTESFQFTDIKDNAPSFETAAPVKQDFTPSFGDDSGDLGGLPDLDTMAMAFSSFGGEPAPAQTQSQPNNNSFEEPEPMVYNKGNKAQPLKGDFNPKELAEGIRTVLVKDK